MKRAPIRMFNRTLEVVAIVSAIFGMSLVYLASVGDSFDESRSVPTHIQENA